MTSTPAHRQNKPHLTDEEGREILESEIEQLRLRLTVLGVCYTRFEDRPGVQVLFETTFILPEGRHLKYARLPFRGLPFEGSAADIQVQAITPEGKQMERVGVYDAKITHSLAPEFGGGAGPANVNLKIFETKKEYDTREIPHNIHLIGYKAAWNERSHWEFHNELPNGKEFRDHYPTHIRLIASFATNHDSEKDDFSFYLRFSSDCQVTLTDHFRKKFRDAIGKPRQYQVYISGPFNENVVKEHIREKKCGLLAAMKRMTEWAQPLEFVKFHRDLGLTDFGDSQKVSDTSSLGGQNMGESG